MLVDKEFAQKRRKDGVGNYLASAHAFAGRGKRWQLLHKYQAKSDTSYTNFSTSISHNKHVAQCEPIACAE